MTCHSTCRPNMTTWKPEVTPIIGDYRQTDRLINEPILMTKTSLAANKQVTKLLIEISTKKLVYRIFVLLILAKIKVLNLLLAKIIHQSNWFTTSTILQLIFILKRKLLRQLKHIQNYLQLVSKGNI